MQYLLAIFAILSFAWGLLVVLISQSAVHEIQAYIAFLTAAVLLVGAGVIAAVQQLRRDVNAAQHRITGGPGVS